MTLEQHGFELCRFTYEWIVVNKHEVQQDTWLVESVNAKPQIKRTNCGT